MSRLFAVAAAGLFVGTSGLTPAQPKAPPGYWQFVEVVRVEYPEEKRNKVYPAKFTWDGPKLTVVAKALSGDLKVVLTEEHQVWSWTPPPQVLVPGEKLPMKLELKLDRPTFDRNARFYLGGTLFAGFSPPKPKDSAIYHVNHQTVTEKGDKGWLWPGENGKTYEPGTYTRESFVVVPARQNPLIVKELPDQISFRVGGGANGRGFNTIYEYKWVEGSPPADRGGPAGDKPKDKPSAVVGGKWEYRVLDIPLDEALGAKLEKRLADLGDEGWEVAGVIAAPNSTPPSIRFVLKRTKK